MTRISQLWAPAERTDRTVSSCALAAGLVGGGLSRGSAGFAVCATICDRSVLCVEFFKKHVQKLVVEVIRFACEMT